jgi:hypothetical protein
MIIFGCDPEKDPPQSNTLCNCLKVSEVNLFKDKNQLEIKLVNDCDTSFSDGYFNLIMFDLTNNDTLAFTDCWCIGPFPKKTPISYKLDTEINDIPIEGTYRISLGYDEIICTTLKRQE